MPSKIKDYATPAALLTAIREDDSVREAVFVAFDSISEGSDDRKHLEDLIFNEELCMRLDTCFNPFFNSLEEDTAFFTKEPLIDIAREVFLTRGELPFYFVIDDRWTSALYVLLSLELTKEDKEIFDTISSSNESKLAYVFATINVKHCIYSSLPDILSKIKTSDNFGFLFLKSVAINKKASDYMAKKSFAMIREQVTDYKKFSLDQKVELIEAAIRDGNNISSEYNIFSILEVNYTTLTNEYKKRIIRSALEAKSIRTECLEAKWPRFTDDEVRELLPIVLSVTDGSKYATEHTDGSDIIHQKMLELFIENCGSYFAMTSSECADLLVEFLNKNTWFYETASTLVRFLSNKIDFKSDSDRVREIKTRIHSCATSKDNFKQLLRQHSFFMSFRRSQLGDALSKYGEILFNKYGLLISEGFLTCPQRGSTCGMYAMFFAMVYILNGTQVVDYAEKIGVPTIHELPEELKDKACEITAYERIKKRDMTKVGEIFDAEMMHAVADCYKGQADVVDINSYEHFLDVIKSNIANKVPVVIPYVVKQEEDDSSVIHYGMVPDAEATDGVYAHWICVIGFMDNAEDGCYLLLAQNEMVLTVSAHDMYLSNKNIADFPGSYYKETDEGWEGIDVKALIESKKLPADVAIHDKGKMLPLLEALYKDEKVTYMEPASLSGLRSKVVIPAAKDIVSTVEDDATSTSLLRAC